jgi:hydroxymethylglutaryl-CoA lyase
MKHDTSSPVDVRIVEVGPRDGLQNESRLVDTATKLELIARLADAGLRDIEATSFVSPRWVPQMGDHVELMERLERRPGVNYPVLCPNMTGFEAARDAGATEVAVFTAASQTFCRRNTNCSIEESLQRFAPMFEAARDAGIRVRGYVSCVVACPYEGPVAPRRVAEVASALFEAGCHEISLGDTIGIGTPASVLAMLDAVAAEVPVARLAGHFHDTYGMAVANAYAAFGFGLRVFDASVGGLGGCPYAKGASGNVATEDLVHLFNGLGQRTGIDMGRLVDCSRWISERLGRPPASRLARVECPA